MNANDLSILYSNIYSPDVLKNGIERVLKYLPEKLVSTHPSIVIGQDGLTLRSLLFVTQNFLCELHLEGAAARTEFDFVAKHSVCNYRIATWSHEIKQEDKVVASFEIAELALLHEYSGFRTTLSFAGNATEMQEWIESLTNAIPINLVLEYSRKS